MCFDDRFLPDFQPRENRHIVAKGAGPRAAQAADSGSKRVALGAAELAEFILGQGKPAAASPLAALDAALDRRMFESAAPGVEE